MSARSAPARCALSTFGLAVALVAGGACDAQGPVTDAPAADEALEPVQRLAAEPLEPPTSGVSRAPQLSVHDDQVMLSWLEFANFRASLRYAVGTPEGWSEAQVAAEGNDFVDNAADISWVRALDDGTLVAQWLHGSSGNPRSVRAGARMVPRRGTDVVAPGLSTPRQDRGAARVRLTLPVSGQLVRPHLARRPRLQRERPRGRHDGALDGDVRP